LKKKTSPEKPSGNKEIARQIRILKNLHRSLESELCEPNSKKAEK